MPGADIGLQAEDPTIATALKAHGYATGQFGKNHLGDRDEFLPTMHGFDEFFGNLYHLNAEEEPELARLPDRGGLPELPRALRPARRDPLVGQRRRHAAHRGHRSAHQEADGDLRRGVPRCGHRLHPTPSTKPTPRSSCGSTPPTCTSARTASPRAGARPAGGSPSTTTRWSTTTTSSGDLLDRARRARPRRGHDRHVLHRQRAAHEHLARRRHDARSATRRTPTGRAPTGCRRWCAGRATSRRARCSTAS